MFKNFEVFGTTISWYGIMSVIGIIAIILYFNLDKKNFRTDEAKVQLGIIYACIGAVVGAKLFYILTILPQFIEDLQMFSESPSAFLQKYLSGGFVFYGGVFGAWAGLALYCRFSKSNVWDMLRDALPALPLFHIFGRIGCFLVGCCYGIEVPTGIYYKYSMIAPNYEILFPVQLVEAGVELGLFLLILFLQIRTEYSGKLLTGVWLYGYGLARFLLEFYRGDEYRGFIWIFSISQWISIICIIIGICLFCSDRKQIILENRKRHNVILESRNQEV